MKITAYRPAFRHPGGKGKMLKQILPLIPPHKVYVEPFCGGCAVLCAKPRADHEVINDTDGGLIAFLRHAQFHSEALISELAKWPGHSRKNFEDLRQNPGITELQRAVRWYLLKVSSFGAKGMAFGRERTAYRGYDQTQHPALIKQLSERLQRVTIEALDWTEVATFHDSPETFFFLDPPYLDCGATAYRPFTTGEMQAVRDFLDTCKGRWILTCDDSPSCRRIFAGLPFVPLAGRYSIGNRHATSRPSGELLVHHPAIIPLRPREPVA